MDKINKKVMELTENLLSINKNIFSDLLIDNFNSKTLEKIFFENTESSKNFFEKEVKIVLEIKKGNKNALKKLIKITEKLLLIKIL